MPRFVTLVLLFVAVWLPGAALVCRIDFAALALEEGVDRDALVSGTYRALLDELGKGIGPAQWKEMAENGKPFLLPEKVRDAPSLAQRLREFERLLAVRRWDVPEVHALLGQVLTEYAAALAGAEGAAKRAGANIWYDYDIAIDQVAIEYNHPDGRYALFLDPGNGFSILDRQTRQVRHTGNPLDARRATADLSPDGKTLIVSTRERGLWTFPFENGDVLWEKGAQILKPDGLSETLVSWTPLAFPNQVSLGMSKNDVLWVDTKAGTITKKPAPAFPEPNALVQNHFAVPGQNRMVFITRLPSVEGYRVSVATYDADGKFTVESNDRRIPKFAGGILLTRDNRLVLTGMDLDSTVQIAPLSSGPFQAMRAKDGTDKFGDRVSGAQYFPERDELYVFMDVNGDSKSRMEIIDLTTGQSRTSITLPTRIYGNYVSPDQKVVYGTGLNDGILHVYNLKSRRDE